MPKRRKSNLSQKTMKSRTVSNARASEIPDNRQARLAADVERHASQRVTETPDDRQGRLAADVVRHASQREIETPDDREARLAANTHRTATQRSENTVEENTAILRERRQQRQNFMRVTWDPFKGIGFRYDPSIDYNNHGLLTLGRMSQTYLIYCEALNLKWTGEPLGICCSNGKVKLPLTPKHLDPLKTLLIGESFSQ